MHGPLTARKLNDALTPAEASALCAPQAQGGEEGVDLRGPYPGARALQPLVKMGGTLGVQPFLPGPLDHSLELRDAGDFPLCRQENRDQVRP